MKRINNNLPTKPQTPSDGVLSTFFSAYGKFSINTGDNIEGSIGKLGSYKQKDEDNLVDEFREVRRRREYLNQYWKNYMPKEKYLTITSFRQRIIQEFFEEVFQECERVWVREEYLLDEKFFFKESLAMSSEDILKPRVFHDYEAGNRVVAKIKKGVCIPYKSYIFYKDGNFDSFTYYVFKEENQYIIYYFEFGDLFFKKADWFGITEEVVKRMWTDSSLIKEIKTKMEEEIFENRNIKCNPEMLEKIIKKEVESRIILKKISE